MKKSVQINREIAREYISQMASDPQKVGHLLLELFNKQHPVEKHRESAIYHNMKGFNGFDAHFLTRMAKYFRRTGNFTEKQAAACMKKLEKYSLQIFSISIGKSLKFMTGAL